MLKSNLPGSFRAEFARAQAQGAKQMAMAPPNWKRDRPWRAWLVPSLIASVALAGGLALAWCVEAVRDQRPTETMKPTRALAGAPERAPQSGRLDPDDQILARPAREENFSSPSLPTSTVNVRRHGSAVSIDFRDSPIGKAVQALAQATNARIHGAEHLGSDGSTVTLKWQGASFSAAWATLLEGVPNTAISCGSASCQIWFLGTGASTGQGGNDTAPTGAPDRPLKDVGSRRPRPAPPPLESAPADEGQQGGEAISG